MIYDVLLTKERDQRYTARALLLPNVIASGSSEGEALEQLRVALSEIQAHSRTVQMEIPSGSNDSSDEWLRFAGMWADDPDWELFQAEIQAQRLESDQ